MSNEMNLYKRCKNIFKFHGVDMGGGGGESAPEVENAIETHGLGWTDTEEKAGFDIQWDGNIEGLESIADQVYKVTSNVDDIDSKDDLIGAKIEAVEIDAPSPYTLSADDISTEDGKVFVCSVSEAPLVFVAIEDGEAYSMQVTKGIWFFKSTTSDTYVTRFYKEASTEEVVHQIDQKYIPGGSGGGGMVVNFTTTQVDGGFTLLADKTPAEVKSAMLSGAVVGTILFPFATEISPIGCAALTNDFLIGFVVTGYDDRTLTLKYMITCDESFTKWILHQG